MKKTTLSHVIIILLLLMGSMNILAQPKGFTYQAVARSGDQVLANSEVTVELAIHDGLESTVWAETHTLTTNEFGLFTIHLGTVPEAVTTQTVDNLSDIPWNEGPYELFVELNGNPMGSSPIQAVPLAMYGKDEDADPGNEIQQLSIDGTQLSLSNGGGTVIIPSTGGDGDDDPYNEIQDLSLDGDALIITNNAAATTIDLSKYMDDTDTDTQLSEAQVDAYVSNNGYLVEEVDGSTTNEIQDLNLNVNALTITNNAAATTIDLSKYLDDTDTRLTEAQVDAYVSNNGYLTSEEDGSTTNELQNLGFSGGILSLSQSVPTVNLKSYVQTVNPWVEGSGQITYSGGNVGVGTETPESVMDVSGNVAGAEPIFQVKNYNGNPVFAVYHDSVRVYVDESAKGIKGGFAVGGYNSEQKAPGQPFLSVTKDSTRIYFDEDAKGIKGGFAVGGYSSTGKAGTSQLMSLEPENYLIGHSAGINLTGLYNQFIGFEAGMLSTTATRNVYMGYQAARGNEDGDYNVTIGYQAGLTSSGYNNVKIGYKAGETGGGYNNVTIGYLAGTQTNGNNSVIIGNEAGRNALGGWSNVFIGDQAGYSNVGGGGTLGARNVFIGREAGMANETGGDNTFIGTFAGGDMVDGHDNTIVGTVAGSKGTTGTGNVYMGYRAGYTNDGDYNLVLGHNAGSAQSNASIPSDYSNNTFLGVEAGYSTTTGNYNTYIGYRAGADNTTGTGNVYIGNQAGRDIVGSNLLVIDNSYGTSSDALIYGDFDATPGIRINGNVGINEPFYTDYGLVVDTHSSGTEAYALFVYGDAYAYTFTPSDKRLKKNIEPLRNALETVRQLNGVSYDWDASIKQGDHNNGKGVGVIAQEIQSLFPELVKEDMDGFLAVHYEGLIPVLIEAVKEQDANNQELRTRLEQQETMIMQLEERLSVLENK
jgi:hypothetical protein